MIADPAELAGSVGNRGSAGLADALDGIVNREAVPVQQAGGGQAGARDALAAVNDSVIASREQRFDAVQQRFALRGGGWDLAIFDWDREVLKLCARCGGWLGGEIKLVDFRGREQRANGMRSGGAPCEEFIE